MADDLRAAIRSDIHKRIAAAEEDSDGEVKTPSDFKRDPLFSPDPKEEPAKEELFIRLRQNATFCEDNPFFSDSPASKKTGQRKGAVIPGETAKSPAPLPQAVPEPKVADKTGEAKSPDASLPQGVPEPKVADKTGEAKSPDASLPQAVPEQKVDKVAEKTGEAKSKEASLPKAVPEPKVDEVAEKTGEAKSPDATLPSQAVVPGPNESEPKKEETKTKSKTTPARAPLGGESREILEETDAEAEQRLPIMKRPAAATKAPKRPAAKIETAKPAPKVLWDVIALCLWLMWLLFKIDWRDRSQVSFCPYVFFHIPSPSFTFRRNRKVKPKPRPKSGLLLLLKSLPELTLALRMLRIPESRDQLMSTQNGRHGHYEPFLFDKLLQHPFSHASVFICTDSIAVFDFLLKGHREEAQDRRPQRWDLESVPAFAHRRAAQIFEISSEVRLLVW